MKPLHPKRLPAARATLQFRTSTCQRRSSYCGGSTYRPSTGPARGSRDLRGGSELKSLGCSRLRMCAAFCWASARATPRTSPCGLHRTSDKLDGRHGCSHGRASALLHGRPVAGALTAPEARLACAAAAHGCVLCSTLRRASR